MQNDDDALKLARETAANHFGLHNAAVRKMYLDGKCDDDYVLIAVAALSTRTSQVSADDVELLEKLRARYTVRDRLGTLHPLCNPNGPEAAARIETLSAEVADQHVYLAEHPDKNYPTRKATKDEAIAMLSKQLIDAHRAALEEAARIAEGWGGTYAHGPVHWTRTGIADAIRNLIGEKS